MNTDNKSINRIMVSRAVFSGMKELSFAGLLALILAFAISGSAQDKVDITGKTVVFQNGLNSYTGAFEIGIEKGKGKLGDKSLNLWVGRKYDSKSKSVEKENQALVRFDDIFGGGASRIPAGAAITKATLRLCVGSKKDAVTFHRIFLNRMLVPWDKNGAWSSPKWGDDGIQADGKEAAVEPDAHFVPNLNNTAYEIDVTESLRAWARGESNHGWVLRDIRDQEVPAAFISSRLNDDIGRRPMLTVSYDTAPANAAPKAESLAGKPSGAGSAVLSLHAADDGKDPLTVTFYGRKRAEAGPDFQVVLLPDTQYYTMIKYGGTPEMLAAQVDWIIKNRKERGIAAVFQLGDLTDTGDFYDAQEWDIIGPKGLYRLEDPAATGLPDGIPYLVAVGNHDQRYKDADGKMKRNGPAAYYNKYFGVPHFKGKSYYGGNHGDTNNNYYMIFDGGAEKFIVISLEYDFAKRTPDVIKWAGDLLEKHPDRRGIVVTHATIFPGVPGEFQDDGKIVYEQLKTHKNLMLIIGGHTTGEGRRTDEYKGTVVHSIVQDFQLDGMGGNGWLGILTFSPRENQIRVENYSPHVNKWRTDSAAKYTLNYDFGTKIEPFVKIASVKVAPNGKASCQWKGLANNKDHEWYAEISDGQKTTHTKVSALTAE